MSISTSWCSAAASRASSTPCGWRRPARVGIVTKKRGADSATNWAQGGIAAVTSPEDSFEGHERDTLEPPGAGLCHEDVVRFVVERGPALIEHLLKYGIEFDRRAAKSADEAGEFDLGREGGHSERRVLHRADTTGSEIESGLLRHVAAHPNITLLEDHCAVDLLTARKGRASGAGPRPRRLRARHAQTRGAALPGAHHADRHGRCGQGLPLHVEPGHRLGGRHRHGLPGGGHGGETLETP